MADKKSFIVYNDWRNAFDMMPDEAAGKLIKALFAFANDEDVSDLDWSIAAPLEQYKSIILRDADKWEKQVEQRSLAGKKSAEARKRNSTKSNDRSTTVDSRARNPTDSVSVSVSVSDSVINNLSIPERKKKFIDEVNKLNLEHKVFSVYGVNEFTEHWAEEDKGKLRWETQKTFETLRRMKAWMRNNYSGKAKFGFRGAEYKNLVY